MILSIDIGTTRTHIAAVDTASMLCIGRIDFDNSGFDDGDGFAAAISSIINAHPQIRRANISSCVKDLSINAKKFCIDSGMIDDAEIIQAHRGLPVEFKYENPQTLGTDRLCNALACAVLFEGEDCVIIDSGTAITVDCLRGGKTFEGGAILPGCAMQARALRAGTDALPEVDFSAQRTAHSAQRAAHSAQRTAHSAQRAAHSAQRTAHSAQRAAHNAQRTAHSAQRTVNTDIIIDKSIATSIPATSTTACITSGILYGTAGAVDRCVRECLCASYSIDTTRIVATGGGWGIIKSLINHKITTLPDLTLIGAAIFSPRR